GVAARDERLAAAVAGGVRHLDVVRVGLAELVDAEDQQQEQRQDQRELDHRLTAAAAGAALGICRDRGSGVGLGGGFGSRLGHAGYLGGPWAQTARLA